VDAATSGSAAAAVRPAVSALIVTYQSQLCVQQCLASLRTEGPGLADVVVVDNGSSDATASLVEAAGGGVRLVRTGANLGYAGAVNVGMAAIAPEHAVLVLNPDVRLDPGAVAVLLDRLGPDVGIAVPRLRGEDGALSLSLRRTPSAARVAAESLLGGRRAARWGLGEIVGDARSYRSERDAEWATGAAWLVSPGCRSTVGPWDESYFLYSEETDYALRAHRHGLRLRFVPEATAVHVGGESGTRPQLWALLTRNRVREVHRRRGLGPAVIFAVALGAGELLRAVRGSATHRAGLLALVRRRETVLRRAGAPAGTR
jgi:GT2 family glycosyltransferase